jgi:hypothetical protein
MRVESKRAGFASKYLFNKNTGPDLIEEVEEEDSYDNEESYSSADYSQSVMTDGYSSNFSVAVASPDSSVEPMQAISMQKYESLQLAEEIATPVIQSHDMIFSCCDWETAMV